MGGTEIQQPPAGLAGIAVRSQRLIQCAVLLLVLSTFVGCAAKQAFKSGERKMQRQDYDAAVLDVSKAVALKPGNTRLCVVLL